MRTHYRNGDDIGLAGDGCDGCTPSMANGRATHELGCPDAWRDRQHECRECGGKYWATDARQSICDACADAADR